VDSKAHHFGLDFVWCPRLGPQKALVDCPLPEVFFGGARGGGKTDGVLGKWALKERRYGQNFNAIMFRRTTVSAEDAIERSKEIYGPLGGKFNEAKLRWRMRNGGRMSFAYLESKLAGPLLQPLAISNDGLFQPCRSALALPKAE
jgi:hypothetical protein